MWVRNRKLSASATAAASPRPSALCAAPTRLPICQPASPVAPGQERLSPHRTFLRYLPLLYKLNIFPCAVVFMNGGFVEQEVRISFYVLLF